MNIYTVYNASHSDLDELCSVVPERFSNLRRAFKGSLDSYESFPFSQFCFRVFTLSTDPWEPFILIIHTWYLISSKLKQNVQDCLVLWGGFGTTSKNHRSYNSQDAIWCQETGLILSLSDFPCDKSNKTKTTNQPADTDSVDTREHGHLGKVTVVTSKMM